MLIRSLMLNVAIVLPLTFFITQDVCAADGEQATEASWPIKKIGRSDARPKPTDIVVKLRQTKEGWLVDQEATLSAPGTEMLWFRRYEKDGEIVVMATAYRAGKENGPSICTFGAASGGQQSREKSGYTECTSEFLSCEATWTDAALAIPFLLTATRTCPMKLDKAKVQQALESAKVFDWLKIEKARLISKQYQLTFSKISNPDEASKFIAAYANNDPDELIPKALALREELMAKEVAAVAAAQIAEEKRVQEKRRADQERVEEQQRLAAAAKESELNREKMAIEFRKNIAIGSDTHCGPVINVRKPMVQVAVNAPLNGYSAEPWLKIQDVYPANVASCRNINGQLQPVFL